MSRLIMTELQLPFLSLGITSLQSNCRKKNWIERTILVSLKSPLPTMPLFGLLVMSMNTLVFWRISYVVGPEQHCKCWSSHPLRQHLRSAVSVTRCIQVQTSFIFPTATTLSATAVYETSSDRN